MRGCDIAVWHRAGAGRFSSPCCVPCGWMGSVPRLLLPRLPPGNFAADAEGAFGRAFCPGRPSQFYRCLRRSPPS
eukprot:11203497-Lingulodinium_polyedra.AAC.1